MTIESLNEFGVTCLGSLWRATWQGAIAAGFVWIVCLCFRRLPHPVRNLLWWLVCAKMLLALSPASLGVPVPADPPPPPSIAAVETPIVPSYDVALSALPYEPAPEPAHVEWQIYICAAWAFGAGVFALFALISLTRAYRMARRAHATLDPSLLAALDLAARQTGVMRVPRLRISNDARDILTLGFFRPAILLPASALERPIEELEVILAHECIHIRRRDPQMGLMPQIAQIVFFFNPLVWLVTREFNISREAACDQAAMAAAQIGPDRYGRLLLALGARQDRGRTLCLPGASSHFHLLRRRIAMLNRISHQPQFRPKRSIAAALALTALLGILPFSLVQGRQATTVALPAKSSPSAAARTPRRKGKASPVHKNAGTHAIAKAAPEPAASQSANVFNLQFAKADDTAATLNRLFKTGGPEIVAEPRTNSILVRGSKAEIGEVTSLLTNLDQPSHDGAAKDVAFQTHLFPIKYARAEDIAKELQTTVAAHGAATIAVDTRTNTLVVVTTFRSLPTIDAVLRELDKPVDEPGTRRIMIRFWKAQDIAKIIAGPLGHPKGLQDITVDTVTNSLVVTAPEDVINHIALLANMFDVEREQVITRRVKVRYGNADDVVKLAAGHMGQPKDVVKVTVDHDDNSIVITASEETINHFQSLVGIFDTPPLDTGQKSRSMTLTTFTLKNAQPEVVVRKLIEHFKDSPDVSVHSIQIDDDKRTISIAGTPAGLATVETELKYLDVKIW